MKKPIALIPFVGAMPVVIVAVKDGEKINFAPHGMFGQLSNDPPLLYVSVLKEHLTAQIIMKTKKFSINIANADLLEKIKYCGSISGAAKDKSNEFEVFYGQSEVPFVSKCPVNMCCEVYQTIETKDMYTFIGRVIEAMADEECILENVPVVTKVDPLICTIQGTFHRMGNEIK